VPTRARADLYEALADLGRELAQLVARHGSQC
jgi:hypothetical protein